MADVTGVCTSRPHEWVGIRDGLGAPGGEVAYADSEWYMTMWRCCRCGSTIRLDEHLRDGRRSRRLSFPEGGVPSDWFLRPAPEHRQS